MSTTSGHTKQQPGTQELLEKSRMTHETIDMKQFKSMGKDIIWF